ncbi:MAG: hypothetical protein LLG14_13355 [Nocardiaceae bacterium]|nr:hypothetical protein [Nocardiaceae bacterium]
MNLDSNDGKAPLPRLGIMFQEDGLNFLEMAQISASRWRYVWVVDGEAPPSPIDSRLMRRFGDVVNISDLNDDSAASSLQAAEIGGITCFSDRHLTRTAAIAHRLGLAYHSPTATRRMSNKLQQRIALEASGMPGPRYVSLPGNTEVQTLLDQVSDFPFPAVCKPQEGEAAVDTAIIGNLDDLRAHLIEIWDGGRSRDMILEEFLPGVGNQDGFSDFVSVECAVINSNVQVIGVRGKMPQDGLRSTGALMPSKLSAHQLSEVSDCAIAAAVGCQASHGVLHTEIKITPDGPRIIEVNGRVGGPGVPELVERQTGVSLKALACELALGWTPTIALSAPTESVTFFYRLQPPLGAIVSIPPTSVEKFAALPGVEGVSVNRYESSGRTGAGMFEDSLLTVHGTAADHDQAQSIYEAMLALLTAGS